MRRPLFIAEQARHAHGFLGRLIAFIMARETWPQNLRAIDARHLFAVNMTRLAIRRGSYLRRYVFDFIETFASPLTRSVVEQALTAPPVEDDAL